MTIHKNVVQYDKGLKSAFAQHFVFTYQNLEKFRSPLVPPSCRSIGRKKPVFMGILIGEVCGLQNRHSPVQIWSSPPKSLKNDVFQGFFLVSGLVFELFPPPHVHGSPFFPRNGDKMAMKMAAKMPVIPGKIGFRTSPKWLWERGNGLFNRKQAPAYCRLNGSEPAPVLFLGYLHETI